MKFLKISLILFAWVFSAQNANAQLQSVCLGNEDPCNTTFELVWSSPSGNFSTVHVVGTTGCQLVTAPTPSLVQVTVVRTGGSSVTFSMPAPGPNQTYSSLCCTAYAQCDDIVEVQWNGTTSVGIGAH